MRTVVFINSHSRQAAQNIKTVKRYLSDQSSKFKVIEYIIIEDLADFDSSLNKLGKIKSVQCVVAGGGDGTIIAVLNALNKRKDIVYGFVPLGTGNTFVKSLGLPTSVRQALRVIGMRNIRKVSLGSINSVLFANIADIGVPAQVADNVTNKVKKYLGSFAYAVSGIRELVRHDAIWCQIKVNGKKHSFYTHQLFIANGKFRGPITVSKETSVFSNTLTLGYSDSKSRWEYFGDAFGFLVGKTDKRKNLIFMQVEKAEIKTDPVQPIQADGEIIGKTPAEIKIVKDAIRVFTKPEEPDRQRKQRKSSR